MRPTLIKMRAALDLTASPLTKQRRMREALSLVGEGLPSQMVPVLKYLILGQADAAARDVADKAERRRSEIATQDGELRIWYSPKPGSAGEDRGEHSRPPRGAELKFSMKRVAHTGKNKKWGTVLNLIAKEFRSTTVVELGTCAGLSGIYLASAPSVKTLITVEGSRELAAVARETLSSFQNVEVINEMFDDAIDTAIPRLKTKIDYAFIDGHHERVATVHYFNRLLPYLSEGAVVVFDDISWSGDMRAGWEELSARPEFSHSIDLGAVGVCLVKGADAEQDVPPAVWNLQPVVGKCRISNPRSWSD